MNVSFRLENKQPVDDAKVNCPACTLAHTPDEARVFIMEGTALDVEPFLKSSGKHTRTYAHNTMAKCKAWLTGPQQGSP